MNDQKVWKLLNEASDLVLDTDRNLTDPYKAPETKLELANSNNQKLIGIISDIMILLQN